MRLLLITDTHLRNTNVPLLKNVFLEAGELMLSKKCDRLVHLGDVFHSRKSQSLDVLMAWGDILDALPCPIHVIPGNHDKVDQTIAFSYLDPFTHHPNLVLHSEIGKVEALGVDVMPFYSDITKESVPNTSKILLAHVGLSDYSYIHKEEPLSVRDLSNYERVCIGHFHVRNFINDKVHYIGSAVPHNFGEQGDKYGFCIINTETYEVEYLPTKHLKPYVVLPYNSIEEVEKDVLSLDAYIRIDIKGKVGDLSSEELARLQALNIDLNFLGYDHQKLKENEPTTSYFSPSALLEEAKEFFKKDKNKTHIIQELEKHCNEQ